MRNWGRITNIQSVPSLAPYFFANPDYSSSEAQLVRESISNDDYRRTLDVTTRCLEAEPDARGVSQLSSLVHAACDATNHKQKPFMTALRHALTAIKTGPTVPETMDVLGRERTVMRLKVALLVNNHTA